MTQRATTIGSLTLVIFAVQMAAIATLAQRTQVMSWAMHIGLFLIGYVGQVSSTKAPTPSTCAPYLNPRSQTISVTSRTVNRKQLS